MRNKNMLLSILVVLALLLAACGAEGTSTSTSQPATDLPPMTETMVATDTPSAVETVVSTTPVIPVTGGESPARLSNQLDFNVWNQNGEEIGEVNDMVIDLDNARISYVIVGTGGFLEIGEKDVLVPWDSLQLQSGDGSTTGGQQNAFILQMDQETFNNAPDTDLNAILPAWGEPAGDWDVDIRNYWESGVLPTADPNATTVPEVVATNTTAVDQPAPNTDLQGVVLATDVLGSNINVGGTPGMAATQDPNTPEVTATPDASQGNPVDDVVASIEDMIVDVETGDIQYVVVESSFDDGEHWIPIPLSMIRWDAANEAYAINVDGSLLRDAPFFTEDQFPDFTIDDWDVEFNDFWQNVESGT
jgi:sporulation protein YlmC with PRC-barrel domain